MSQRRPFEVQDVMSDPQISIPVDASLYDADAVMDDHQVDSLFVVNSADQLVGTLSRNNIRWALSDGVFRLNDDLEPCKDPKNVLVQEAMKTDLITVSPTDLIQDAADCMWDNQVTILPVVDDKDGRLVGVLTKSELFSWIIKAWADHPLPSRRTLR